MAKVVSQPGASMRSLWRSRLLWQLLAGSLVAALALIGIGATALANVTDGLAQSQALRQVSDADHHLNPFLNQLDDIPEIFGRLGSGIYDPNEFARHDKLLLDARATLGNDPIPAELQTTVTALLTFFDQLQPQIV